ncbi:hypothetical protein LAZ67_2001879 [Cordylochernes scorpioides]|uniref:Transporter n=1 Tax=Cordylochernes scorpioides TaxID=51811 RepID=A0ABY6K3A8_9ARAC|nr:hypothetical protein LAZ67_2001879 [Cordylochernes scorpioides]
MSRDGNHYEATPCAEAMIRTEFRVLQPKVSECSSGSGSSDDVPGRGQWTGKLDFLFSCINYAVGLGNVWRFPYLCYENGGDPGTPFYINYILRMFDILFLDMKRVRVTGAFLLPYIICLFICGIPAFFLEVSIGQYLSAGGIGVWELVPIFKGVGFASITIVFLYNIYYVIIVAWIICYLVSSFTVNLPWSSCDNWWNTDSCVELDFVNSTVFNATAALHEPVSSSVSEFWERRVLGNLTSGMHDLGSLNFELSGYLLLAWALVYVVICRGLDKSGKIIWFTALFPYVTLTSLLIRGLTLEGAQTGVLYYLTPTWSKLLEAKVWVAAATQVFFTFGIGFGSVITLGSYNKFHHNYFRDSFILCFVNPGTSVLAGFVIFSVLGHLSYIQGVPVEDVVKAGPGLAFLTYPEVVSYLPVAPLWAVLFFLMLLVLGVDSQFCTVEALVTGLVDEWPSRLRPHRKLFTLLVCFCLFLLGLPMVTQSKITLPNKWLIVDVVCQGGIYLFRLMDFYSASGITLLFTVFFQTIAISWIYGQYNRLQLHFTYVYTIGVDRMGSNIKNMIGHSPNMYFLFAWKYSIPAVTMAIVIFSIVRYEPLVYADDYVYPLWGNLLGWMMGLTSMVWVPLYAIYFLATSSGSLKEVQYSHQLEEVKDHQLNPQQ